MFLNNKKIPLMPPSFFNNRFMTGFKEKTELISLFLSKQCSHISSNSSLPSYSNYTNEKRSSTVALFVEDICKII